jgi:hypothetical protein
VGILTQLLPRERTLVGLNVNSPLFLFDLKKTWNVYTNFSNIPQNQISSKSVERFLSCYMRTEGKTDLRTDRHEEVNRRTFITFSCELA